MKRALLYLGAVMALFGTASVGKAQTAVPYKFLFGSTMIESGGIAGDRSRWHVLGPFDFEIFPDPRDHWPPQDTAKFSNVEAWATHEMMTVIHQRTPDEIFNFSGLTGHELLTPGPLDVFLFKGTTEDDSSVQITTGLLGRWMFVRAKTEAPANYSDYFEYTLRALARQQPTTDLTGNDVVDGKDLTALVPQFGVGAIDGANLLAWQREVGAAPDIAEFERMVDAAIAAAESPTVTAVPEPNSLATALIAIAAFTARRRR